MAIKIYAGFYLLQSLDCIGLKTYFKIGLFYLVKIDIM